MVCTWLNADFDGDQLGVFLPLTAGAQQEAGDLLSVAGQLAHHPELMASLSPVPESCWGLAYLSLSEAGRAKLNSILGEESIPTGQILSRDRLAALKASILAKHGTSGSLRLMEQLDQAGFAAAKASGASMSPFLGSSLQLPPAPNSESPREWETYITEISEKILSLNDYTSLDMGPQSLDSRIRIWVRQALPRLVAPLGLTEDATGQPVIVRHSFTQGLTPGEMMACVAGARQGLANWAMQSESIVLENHPRGDPASLNVLSRARRSKHPGIVFARAAANGEVDPLEDVESRLLVGLPVE
jgi:DNA-directed RNA polymerase beta' subunit